MPQARPRALGLLTLTLAGLLSLAACTSSSTPTPVAEPTPRPTSVPSTPTGATHSPAPGPRATLPDAPQRDWLALLAAYRGIVSQPVSDAVLYPKESPGAQRSFWAIDVDGPAMFRLDAELRHVSERALWYVADGVNIDDRSLVETGRAFDRDIYPSVFETFAPSADPPGRITIVNADLPGLAGYFSGVDALSTDANRFSNERVSLFMNGTSGVSGERYLGTLAHELQHLAHSLVDPTEETWVHEGLSELAVRSLGLPALPVSAYLRDPSVSLIDWPLSPGASIPNYAGGALFSAYLADRTGLDSMHRLVAQQEDSVAGVQAYLDEVSPGLSFDDLYADWLVANLVDASSGRFAYSMPAGTVSVEHELHGPGVLVDTLPQRGGWYLRIEPEDGPLTVRFEGSTATPLLPVLPHSGDACWWGNRGDSIDSSLTRTLDLTGLSEATLRFWTWHEIEEQWDHAYVAVSDDGGRRWQALDGKLTSRDDPVGSSLGPSYTGSSDGWRREEIDLTPFAGRAVLLRFNYVTDESVNAAGWCIDDIEVPEAGFADDAESDRGWQADGFVRQSSRGVAQRFLLRVVTGTGDGAQVAEVEVDDANRASFTVDGPVVMVLTAIAAKTTQPAAFRLTTAAR